MTNIVESFEPKNLKSIIYIDSKEFPVSKEYSTNLFNYIVVISDINSISLLKNGNLLINHNTSVLDKTIELNIKNIKAVLLNDMDGINELNQYGIKRLIAINEVKPDFYKYNTLQRHKLEQNLIGKFHDILLVNDIDYFETCIEGNDSGRDLITTSVYSKQGIKYDVITDSSNCYPVTI